QQTSTIASLDERPNTRKPAPPFTTSTLQQEANRKLGLSARRTMQVAQSLYERGYITYMRTDSVHLSDQAVTAARNCVEQKYGPEYLSPKPRQYTTKSKNAQEAHEAIRPAGSQFRTPQETGLNDQEFRLYDLIWKRTVACQMADARQTLITVQIQVEEATFRASGKRIDFPGFFRAYVEGSDDPDAALENQEVLLPTLAEGDTPSCQDLTAIGHETQPPARFTEASLVKALESEGIGRPSTYASIIGTILDRDYAHLQGNALAPTFTAFAVTEFLEKHFPDLVDTRFTARMEQTLDDISMGETEWLPYLQSFYNGDQGLANQVKTREDQIDPTEARTITLDDLAAKIRIGRYGAYLEAEAEEGAVRASIPKDVTPADLNDDQVSLLLRQKTEGPDQLGIHPETGQPIYRLMGPYGPYVQLGDEGDEADTSEGNGKKKAKAKPKRASLPKGVTLETVTLAQAIGLLALPRLLGEHPETGGKIQAGLGRFGPYVVHTNGKDKDFRSLKAGDDVLTVALPRALELLAQPKRGKGSKSTKTPLREMGPHPEDQEPVNIYDGPYGPYVKHGKVNASLPEGVEPADLTMEQAIEALAAKAGTKGKSKAKGGSKATKTKTAAKSSGKSSSKSGSQSSKSTKAKKSSKSAAADPPLPPPSLEPSALDPTFTSPPW
ncbi:MAG: type I DNA topoisomerase, partial [Prochlorothrix sp.]